MASRPFAGISEQSRAGRHRRVDADSLFEKERWRGAMYVAGYSMECLIKAKLMEKFRCRHLDGLEVELKGRNLLRGDATLYDHRIELYLSMAGALQHLREDADLWRQFTRANRWQPSWRYDPNPASRDEAEAFLAAVDTMLDWIDHNI